jgi:hypothetical protein
MAHTLTCMAHTLTCMAHTLTCKAHTLTYMAHTLTYMAHTLTCMAHTLTYMAHLVKKVYSRELGLWCLMPFATIPDISMISWLTVFIGGGNQSIRRKPLINRKSQTNFIT